MVLKLRTMLRLSDFISCSKGFYIFRVGCLCLSSGALWEEEI